MRKLLLLVGLSMLGTMMLASVASAQQNPYGCPDDKPFVATLAGDPGEGSLRCFATQAEANAYRNSGPDASPTASPGINTIAESCNDQPDPAGCKRQLRGAEGFGSATPSATASATSSTTASATASATATASSVLPATGGPVSLVALVPLALLAGSGILAFGLVRRR